ncbi:Nucleoside-diphosphate-sugar epimerase [Nitrosospira multiformis ATCC 25196]|uniref:NAD-dependent epimerase/dehydratase n=1 Tax=Nitrosospira multiformis (strain ATCC 25196 / NCIMB 11849 / C 71) TaxID=323848 RepID=Q2Y734_NITMU|nr:NAD(P)H-binding protein [Nitrosospira multiformis]ABB75437.1 NAD-dependent epimerase/dehydratase [Nitrosospira multiformis ATCC 25196]SEF86410.1 Nucleoside-diphosphate-sugar epimerase [Nitrosospira multiformis ATCC 25196]
MSTILITGASGFIGSHLVMALAAAGHRIVCATRRGQPEDIRGIKDLKGTGPTYIAADFTRDFDMEVWKKRLAGIDVVINAVGILREHGRQTFQALHDRAPRALFAACEAANVKVVQISALGADENARSRYHLSKKAADDALLASPNNRSKSMVVQPSLVYGPGGTSAQLFNLIASLPVIPLPGAGNQRIQPIHIDDLTQAVVELLQTDRYLGQRIPLVGPEPITFRDYLGELRHLMGLGTPTFLPVPVGFVEFSARRLGQLSQRFGKGLLDLETWQMLQRGNIADPAMTRALLGRNPRPVREFASKWEVQALRLSALLGWLPVVLRVSLAAVWFVAGAVSMGIYPVEESYVLLARVGITGGLAPIALYGAAAMDIAFGFGTLFLRDRRLLWIAQVTLIGVYMVAITLFLPEFWLHPFGPLIKNLPILAVILLLYELEKR